MSIFSILLASVLGLFSFGAAADTCCCGTSCACEVCVCDGNCGDDCTCACECCSTGCCAAK